MPFLGTLPIAVAPVVIAKLWRRRDASMAGMEAQNQELREELATLRRELTDAQERLDFAERVLTQQRRTERLPDALDGLRASFQVARSEKAHADDARFQMKLRIVRRRRSRQRMRSVRQTRKDLP